MKKYFEALKKCPLFNDINDADMTAMLGCLSAREVSFAKNEIIMREGEPARDVGIMLEGSAQIVRMDYYGNRSIVANIEPSEMFGESFACAEVESLPMDVVASENCTVLMVDCRRLISSCSNACEFHNRMIFNLMKTMAQKNLIFNRKLEIISKRSTREKLMAYLMMQAKIHASGEFEIPFNRQELADYLEVERSGLSAEISKMRNEGIIDTNKNRFKLLE